MKKITSIALSILLVISLSACNNANPTNQDAKIKELEEQITSLQSELEEKPSSSSKQESSLSTASSEVEKVEKSVAFTNKFGTATTKCAQSGCVNYIASSGDTNCCISHSNKCIDCSCYIDGDAAWCISCIQKALE